MFVTFNRISDLKKNIAIYRFSESLLKMNNKYPYKFGGLSVDY